MNNCGVFFLNAAFYFAFDLFISVPLSFWSCGSALCRSMRYM